MRWRGGYRCLQVIIRTRRRLKTHTLLVAAHTPHCIASHRAAARKGKGGVEGNGLDRNGREGDSGRTECFCWRFVRGACARGGGVFFRLFPTFVFFPCNMDGRTDADGHNTWCSLFCSTTNQCRRSMTSRVYVGQAVVYRCLRTREVLSEWGGGGKAYRSCSRPFFPP